MRRHEASVMESRDLVLFAYVGFLGLLWVLTPMARADDCISSCVGDVNGDGQVTSMRS
jgi:hypothetical protein